MSTGLKTIPAKHWFYLNKIIIFYLHYLYSPVKLSCVTKADIFKDMPKFLSVNVIATCSMVAGSILISSYIIICIFF